MSRSVSSSNGPELPLPHRWREQARAVSDGAPPNVDFSLVLPAFNEVEALPPMLDACASLVERLAPRRAEVVFVDDGSSDGTEQLLKQAAEDHLWLRYVRHSVNRGYGAALRSGFDAARGDVVAYTDADGQFDVLEFAEYVDWLPEVDLVAGFRVYRFDPLPRLLVSWIYNRLVRLLFKVPVRDVDCSFKLMKRDKLDRLLLMCDDFFIDTEIVARARKWNWRIVEVGVRHYPRTTGKTTVRPGDIPRTLRRIANMWWAIHFPNRRRHSTLLAEQTATRARARAS